MGIPFLFGHYYRKFKKEKEYFIKGTIFYSDRKTFDKILELITF